MNAPTRKRTQFLVRFGYDGARFHGLQPQRDLQTAGGAVRDRLTAAAGVPPKMLHFAARTDAGVHAIENIATCYAWDMADVDGFCAAVCQPRDDGLSNVSVEVVPHTVHARGSSNGKHYRYRVVPGSSTPSSRFQRQPDAWHVAPELDVARMQRAAATLVGTHDFSSLRNPKCTAKDPNKTMARVDVNTAGGAIIVDIVGDAFLRQMVRNMVGLLVEVGSGWRSADAVGDILAARHRSAAGLCAPPEGLTLVRVGFDWPLDGRGRLPELALPRKHAVKTAAAGL